MSQLNGKGPENNGATLGRGLGRCSKHTELEKLQKMGIGMGKRRNSSKYNQVITK